MNELFKIMKLGSEKKSLIGNNKLKTDRIKQFANVKQNVKKSNDNEIKGLSLHAWISILKNTARGRTDFDFVSQVISTAAEFKYKMAQLALIGSKFDHQLATLV